MASHRPSRPRLRSSPLVVVLLLTACGGAETPPAQPSAAAPRGAAPAVAARADAAAEARTRQELVTRANTAFTGERFVAPIGDNALELFLAVRAADPGYLPAQEALVELFPIAVAAIGNLIERSEFSEARRVLALLDMAVPGSLAVAELERRLDGAERDGEPSPEPNRTATPVALAPTPVRTPPPAAPVVSPPRDDSVASGPTRAPAAPAPAAALASPPVTTAARNAGDGPTPPVDAVAPPAARTATDSAPAAATAAASTRRDPVAIARIAPQYPPQARQRRLEGWVELEFTVTESGAVEEIVVVGAEPARVFDREAVRALMRWKFRPAERDGRPERARTRTRIDFRLG